MEQIDLIRYGTPTVDQSLYLSKKTYLEKFFAQLTTFSFPRNNSDIVVEELNELTVCVSELSKDVEAQTLYYQYDEDIFHYFRLKAAEGSELEKIVDDIAEDVIPLVLKLKYYFQRPRPYQLAFAHKLKLFPFRSYSACSPSYPSGHTVYSKVLCEVIGNAFPKQFNHMLALSESIRNSRLHMGLNYQSDIDVGLFLADLILNDEEFKLKYRL